MRTILIGFLLLFWYTSSAETPCYMKIGDLQFEQPPYSAEAYISETNDTTWRIRYIIPESNKQDIINSIFGSMHYYCNEGVYSVRSFNLTVIGENSSNTVHRYITKSYILRDETLENILKGNRFKIYMDNIYLFHSGKDVQSIAIEFGEK